MGLVEKPEGRIPFGRPKHRWDDIKMDLQEVIWAESWTGLIWLRIGTRWWTLVIMVMNFGLHKMRDVSRLAENW